MLVCQLVDEIVENGKAADMAADEAWWRWGGFGAWVFGAFSVGVI